MSLPPHESVGGSERFLAADVQIRPYGRRSVILYRRATGRAVVAAKSVAEILAVCARPRTLAGHKEYLTRWLPASGTGGSRQFEPVLQQLVEAGYLISESGLLRVRPDAEESRLGGCSVDHVVVPTLGRRRVLERGLRLIEQHVRRGAGHARVTVLDDSRTPEAAQCCKSARAVAFSESRVISSIVSIPNAGRAVRQLLAAKCDIDPRVVEFALGGAPECPSRLGAARNIALLLCNGGMLLLDDDIECRPVNAAPCPSGVVLRARADPAEVRYFATPGELDSQISRADLDPVTDIERFLGRDLGPLLQYADRRESVEVLGLDERLESALLRNNGRIVRVSPGLAGDSGSEAGGFFFADPASLPDVFSSEDRYRAVVESRLVWRASPLHTISTTRSMMGGNVALDNRELLPPFLPVGRASDFLFGQLLDQVRPDALSAHLPWATPHSPEVARRTAWQDIWTRLTGMQLANVLDLLLGSAPPLAAGLSPEQRMDRLGLHLEDVAGQAMDEFEGYIRTAAWAAGGSQVGALEGALAGHRDLPPYFVADLKKYLQIVLSSQTGDAYAVPLDLQEWVGLARARVLCREFVQHFGQLLRAWPRLIAEAHRRSDELREAMRE